jgi:diphthamide synthase (EF-2-diphthine--ammonia ligase)
LVAASAHILSQQLAFCVIFVAKRSLAELEVCMELHKKVLETATTLCTGLALDILLENQR